VIIFQSTRPRGARRYGGACRTRSGRFQSTRPRGRDIPHNRARWCSRFQSTRPRGARTVDAGIAKVHIRVVSIHAPARGATSYGTESPAQGRCFQSTRPRGARQFSLVSFPIRACSIHAPARGATSVVNALSRLNLVSNPPARAGANPPHTYVPPIPVQFQSTRPRGARL
jgi:hypothetical protein